MLTFSHSARPLRVLRSSRPEPNFICPRRPQRLPAPLHKPSLPLLLRSGALAVQKPRSNQGLAAQHRSRRSAFRAACGRPFVVLAAGGGSSKPEERPQDLEPERDADGLYIGARLGFPPDSGSSLLACGASRVVLVGMRIPPAHGTNGLRI